MMFSYPDYSKSESDKRAVSKQNSSGSQALVYGNESQSDVLKRRLSFDISGDSILSTGGNQRKSPNPLSYEASGKYCPVIKRDESNLQYVLSKRSYFFFTSLLLESRQEKILNIIAASQADDQEETVESTCSSPEQETVRPKQSGLTCTRGPHVQHLFDHGAEAPPIASVDPISSPSNDQSALARTVEVSDDEAEPIKPNEKDS